MRSADAVPVNLADTAGFDTRGARWVHAVLALPVGSSVTWQLWLFDRVAQRWWLDTRLGLNGTVTLAAGDPDNPQGNIIEVGAASHVWIRFATVAGIGASAPGVDVWLSGVGEPT